MLCRNFRGKQLVRRDMLPIILGQIRLDGPGMLRNGNRVVPRDALQVQIKRLCQARHAGLARAVRVPAAVDIAARAPDLGAHGRVDGAVGEALLRAQMRALAGQEVVEVFQDQQRADGVDLEGLQRLVAVDLRRRLLGVQYARDGEREAQVRGVAREHLLGGGGGGGDCEFIWCGGRR